MKGAQPSERSISLSSRDNLVRRINWKEVSEFPHGSSTVDIVFRLPAENLWIDYCIQKPTALWALLEDFAFRIGGVASDALQPLKGGLAAQLLSNREPVRDSLLRGVLILKLDNIVLR